MSPDSRNTDRSPPRDSKLLFVASVIALVVALDIYEVVMQLRDGRSASRAGATIHAAWAQLVPKDVACVARDCEVRILARAVVPLGASCEGLASASQSNRPIALQRRKNTKPDRFPIDVCEALLTLDDEGVKFAGGQVIRWIGLKSGPRAISIIGDTGCHASDGQASDGQASDGQDCNTLAEWPLANVANEAAWLRDVDVQRPDLVIHVGDYRYRGKDDWSNWQADFFAPARMLLLAAPWVMVRGNHENCYTEQGTGWAFLLSPRFRQGPDCEESSSPRALIEPAAAIDLAGLRLVTLDAADAKYRCSSWRDTFQEQELPKLKTLLDPSLRGDRVLWLLTHYPVLNAGTSPECPSDGKKASVAAYQQLLVPVLRERPVDAILAGDLHSLQLLHSQPAAGGTNRIVQLIVGNGGTKLDAASEALVQLSSRCTDAADDKRIDCADLELGRDQGYLEPIKVSASLRFEHGLTTAVKKDGTTWLFESRTLRSRRTEIECTIPVTADGKCGPRP